MKILAIDSSSNVASVALTDEDKLLGEYSLNHKKTHSQNLMPMTEQLLAECETPVSKIDLFAVAAGPGSFTGLRIGVATVKALAHAVGKPVCGVSTLEAMAYHLPFYQGVIVPIMDARRNQVYTAVYQWRQDALQTVLEPCALGIEELCEQLKQKKCEIAFLGDGVPVHREFICRLFGGNALFAPANANMQKASCVAAAARKKAAEGKVCRYDELLPVYLRKSQAEREYEEKHGNEK